ncbi:MAG TPA: SMC-Scp complex subunit ScpB [Pseudomonadales bacterium]|nr:SMC-Scp complex subunit ScpB [Pseudomonadales bacterium]
MSIVADKLKNIVEASLLAAGRPLSLEQLLALFEEDEQKPSTNDLAKTLETLQNDYQQRGVELVKVASGYRFQVKAEFSSWTGKLWEDKPSRYSRALLETLALIAYRQPITRGEIEAVRGVAVSTNIIKTLQEREWVRIVGHRDVPGRPAMYATTRGFLDYFNLNSLDELPALTDIRDLGKINEELLFEEALVERSLGDSLQRFDAHLSKTDASSEATVLPALRIQTDDET